MRPAGALAWACAWAGSAPAHARSMLGGVAHKCERAPRERRTRDRRCCRRPSRGPPTHASPPGAVTAGTMAGVLPVVEVDGRAIGGGRRGPMVARLQALYAGLMDREAAGGREASLPEDARG